MLPVSVLRGFATAHVVIVPLLLIAGLRAAVALRRELPAGRAARGALLAVLAGGLVARLVAVPFLADIRPSLLSAVSITAHRWSAAWAGFLYPFPEPLLPETMGRVGAVLGALSLPLLYRLLRRVTDDETTALAGTAVAAFLPPLVKFSVGSGPQALVGLLFLLAALRLVEWAAEPRPWRLFVATVALAVCADLRPEAALCVVAAVALGAARFPWRAPWPHLRTAWAALLAAPLFVPSALVAFEYQQAWDTSGGWLSSDPLAFLAAPSLFRSPLMPAWLSPIAALGGLALLARRRFRAGIALWLAAALLSLGQTEVLAARPTNHRYLYYFLLVYAGLVGSALAGLVAALRVAVQRARPRWDGAAAHAAPALVVLAAIVPLVLHADALALRWSHTDEYDLLVPALRDVPDDCVVVSDLDARHELGLAMGGDYSRLAGRRHAWHDIEAVLADGLPAGACHVAWLGAFCYLRQFPGTNAIPEETFRDERPVCTALRERYHLTPIAEGSAPFRPYVASLANRDVIPFGLYRIDNP